MNDPKETAEALLDRILAVPRAGKRRLIALVGQPASGKSTLSNILAELMTEAGCRTSVVPMDGFHLDNQILISQGLLPRKGAPETFDVDGLFRLIKTLRSADTVFFPVFDRERDISIAGAGMLSDDCDSVIVEGNYLLLDAPGWRDLKDCWDLSVQLDVPIPILRERLVDRWLAYGLTLNQAITRAEGNDLRNAELIAAHSLSADVIITA
ncbi:MAG: nucleoside/nucleotide kinase family protein [Rhodobacteraceae bacterium]|uniref:nucleoside/nucleotide kinase family protein n=1 Tax=Celeribacter sp. HF31 TaxID=2721558 RepID=UPI00142F515C|nr:nucleoside/nucleotide kinase family protein [Celeribacter sp. HF31]NIY79255.1 nucleoside/nucleotide kinase family protein [Celeribacter sp. HF31]NVK45803.1 nucleoside/nucleotide kinase family protein [Paracoccaceae bacterium]